VGWRYLVTYGKYLANNGYKVALFDADIGGANLECNIKSVR